MDERLPPDFLREFSRRTNQHLRELERRAFRGPSHQPDPHPDAIEAEYRVREAPRAVPALPAPKEETGERAVLREL